MSKISKLTFAAAIIAAYAGTSGAPAQAAHHKRAHAQSYSFPTWAVLHPGKSRPKNTVPGSAAEGESR
jgi:hypothetical protein